MLLRDLLPVDRPALPTVAAHVNVAVAVARLVRHQTRFLVVERDGLAVGLFFAVDAALDLLGAPRRSREGLPVADVAVGLGVRAAPQESVHTGLQRLLHHDGTLLPIMEGADLLGVLELRTLVRCALADLAAEIDTLNRYIQDLHAAAD
jgi:CBS domain-containing protein